MRYITKIGLKIITTMAISLLFLALMILFLFDRSLQIIKKESTSISSEALQNQGVQFIDDITREKAAIINTRLQEVAEDIHSIPEYQSRLVLPSFASSIQLSDLTKRPKGYFVDANSARSADIYIRQGADMDDPRIIRDFAFAGLFNNIFPVIFEGNSELSALYFVGDYGITQIYPSFVTSEYPGGIGDFIAESGYNRDEDPGYLETRQVILETKKKFWFNPVVDAENNIVMGIAEPIFVDDVYQGMIGADLTLTDYISNINSLKPTPSSFAFLVDAEGKLIAAPLEYISSLASTSHLPVVSLTSTIGLDLHILGNANIKTLLDAMAQDDTGVHHLQINNEDMVVAFSSLPETGWRLAIASPTRELIDESQRVEQTIQNRTNSTFQSTITVTILFFLAVLLLLGIVSQRITQPIRTLEAATHRLSNGDFSSDVPVISSDEIGSLSRSFNQMSADIAKSRRDLEKLNESLEIKVEERTGELIEARKAAEHANELKSHFLASMSHELRTPLNAIINYTYFLANPAEGEDPEDQHMYLERVRLNADHLLGLINDILDLSKIEAGHIALVLEPVILPPLIQSVASTAQSLIKDKPVTLILDIDPELPVLSLDKTRIRQVLLNLLSNAAKFTERGTITLRAARVADAVKIDVIDTGVGIPVEAQERVFAEFQQVDHALNRTYAGTGLGLPISKRLVELHGGTLTLLSTPGVGSTFTVSLPMPLSVPTSLVVPNTNTPRVVSQPHILVVDDDLDTHMVLRRILEETGYRISALADSRLVLTTLQQRQPDLVILDMRMPYFDGWAVLRQIRSDPQFQDLPVILCSMVDVEPSLIGLLGIADYLVKPVRSEEVQAAVLRWITPAQTVLLIDDDPDVRTTTSRALSAANLHVVLAASGAEGLRLAAADPPGVIILDLMMPEMDGFEVINQLQQLPTLAHIPLIVITAKDLTADEQQWLQSQVLTILHKTQVAPDGLVNYLRTVLSQKG